MIKITHNQATEAMQLLKDYRVQILGEIKSLEQKYQESKAVIVVTPDTTIDELHEQGIIKYREVNSLSSYNYLMRNIRCGWGMEDGFYSRSLSSFSPFNPVKMKSIRNMFSKTVDKWIEIFALAGVEIVYADD